MTTLRDAYDELYVYTMGRPGFILQHVVDAFAAQAAEPGPGFKPIGLVFALPNARALPGRRADRVGMTLPRLVLHRAAPRRPVDGGLRCSRHVTERRHN